MGNSSQRHNWQVTGIQLISLYSLRTLLVAWCTYTDTSWGGMHGDCTLHNNSTVDICITCILGYTLGQNPLHDRPYESTDSRLLLPTASYQNQPQPLSSWSKASLSSGLTTASDLPTCQLIWIQSVLQFCCTSHIKQDDTLQSYY